jgi:hypothetical protein
MLLLMHRLEECLDKCCEAEGGGSIGGNVNKQANNSNWIGRLLPFKCDWAKRQWMKELLLLRRLSSPLKCDWAKRRWMKEFLLARRLSSPPAAGRPIRRNLHWHRAQAAQQAAQEEELQHFQLAMLKVMGGLGK